MLRDRWPAFLARDAGMGVSSAGRLLVVAYTERDAAFG